MVSVSLRPRTLSRSRRWHLDFGAREERTTMIGFDPARRCLLAVPDIRQLETLRWGRSTRYRLTLDDENRMSINLTRCPRLPRRHEASTGPVLAFVGGVNRDEPLRIVIMRCPTSAVAHSISSMLLLRCPHRVATTDACDIDSSVIEFAWNTTYDPDGVLGNRLLEQKFAAAAFERMSGRFVVQPQVAHRVRFRIRDSNDGRVPSGARSSTSGRQTRRSAYSSCSPVAPRNVGRVGTVHAKSRRAGDRVRRRRGASSLENLDALRKFR